MTASASPSPSDAYAHFSGHWIYSPEKTDRDDVDAVLAQQGVPWLMRKAASLATPTMDIRIHLSPLKDVEWFGAPDQDGEEGREIDWEELVVVIEQSNRSGLPALPHRTQINPLHSRPTLQVFRIPGFPEQRIEFVSSSLPPLAGESNPRFLVRAVNEREGWTNEAIWSVEVEDSVDVLVRTMNFKKGKFERRYRVAMVRG